MKVKTFASLLADIVLMSAALAQTPEMKEPAMFAPGAQDVVLSMPKPGRPFTGLFRVKNGEFPLIMNWGNGSQTKFTLSCGDQQEIRYPANKKQIIRSRNGILKMDGIPVKEIYVRPNLHRYDDDKVMEVALNSRQDVREKIVKLKIEKTDDGLVFYVDGSYAGTLHSDQNCAGLRAFPRQCMQYCDISKEEITDPRYHVIDFPAKEYRDVKAELKFTEKLPVPMEYSDTGRDLRKLHATASKAGYIGDQDRARTAFDAMPESLIWSVPAYQYINAWILCAPIVDNVNKPEFKVLMTRWAPEGRGNAVAETVVTLQDNQPDVTKVGSAVLEIEGKKQEVPLYLVKAAVRHGKIQDLIYTDPHASLPFHDYLDLEFQGPNRDKKPEQGKLAAAVVFGVSLEKSPLAIQFTQKLPGNVFEPGEKTELPVQICAKKAGTYTLNYAVRDVDGKAVESATLPFTLKEQEKMVLTVEPEVQECGWYGIDFTVSDEKGFTFSDYHAAFTRLQENTRQAGYDSPYSCWWDHTAHYKTPDPNVIAPLLYRAGTLKTTLYGSALSEKDLEKWKITLAQVPFPRYIYYGAWYDEAKRTGKFDKLEEELKNYISRIYETYPHAGDILMFHESFSDYPQIPLIFEGKKMPAWTGTRLEKEQNRLDQAKRMCTIFRKYFPDKKIVIGNCCHLPGMIQAFTEEGFPQDLVDKFGIETPGSGIPENLEWTNGAGGFYLARETGKLTGFSKPLTCTYEWTIRRKGACGGLKGQAEYLVRDILVAHIYGCSLISVSGIQEAGNTYFYDANYGEDELCSRELHPYPSYTAVAVATRILDRVQFKRLIPAGNNSVYLAEFTRADGKNIYALWTTKGFAECELKFNGISAIVMEDLYGRRQDAPVSWGTLKIRASSAVTWFVTKRDLTEAKTLSVSNPLPPEIKPEKMCTLTKDDIEFVGKDERIDAYYTRKDDILHPVPVAFENADDPVAGKAIEFTFDLSPLKGMLYNRGGYAAFKLKKEIPIDDRINAIGFRAKGNGSKGRIIYVIRDANKQEFISFGEPWNGGGGLNDLYDDFKFEGWDLLSMALTKKYARPAGWFSMQWYGCPVRSKEMKRPYVLTGFILTTFPKKERVDGYSDAEQKVRISDVVFYE